MEEHDVQSAARAELHEGESLVWWGQPSGKAFSRGSWPLFFFGIVWLAFSLFWAVLSFLIFDDDNAAFVRYFYALFSIPFILIGLRLIASPFIENGKAGRTVYAITNMRAMVITTGLKKKVSSLPAKDILKITRKDQPDGSGNITFSMNYPQGRKSSGTYKDYTFLGIPDVKIAEMYIHDFLLNSKTNS